MDTAGFGFIIYSTPACDRPAGGMASSRQVSLRTKSLSRQDGVCAAFPG